MDKLDLKSKEIVDNNIEKIGNLFPNTIVESEKGKTIDFDLLKQELSDILVEGNKEKYQLTWPGKKDSILKANTPTNKTLRPCKEESVNFDNTENLYIEGDNLEVLKILQESYLNKIKVIYIDPPYNTGNDFIYKDDFKKTTEEELLESGQTDEEGNRLVSNNQSSGRYHSDWLSMMYSRLKLARNLLTEDGIFFLQIGEEEVSNLEKIANEIFGDNNKLGFLSRVSKTASNKGNFFAPSLDYILCYAKDSAKAKQFKDKVDSSLYKKTEIEGEKKGWKYRDDVALFQSGLIGERPNCRYFIECPDNSKVIPPINKFWRWGQETLNKNINNLVFKETKNSPLFDENGKQAKWNIYTKSYLLDREENGIVPRNYIDKFLNRNATDQLKSLKISFDYSKPLDLMKYLLEITQIKSGIVLDFFSGSATTAHATMQLNVEDNGSRKYIMVQLPEIIENSEFKNICELGKERIRRAGKKIKEETGADIDYGFRVYKLDSSNMKDVYYNPNQLGQAQLDLFESNIKEDRTSEDLLTQIILDLGLELSLKIDKKEILGNKVYFVEDNSLVACFDEKIDMKVIDEIAKENPLILVFKDASFDDNSKINVSERMKRLSPETEIKII